MPPLSAITVKFERRPSPSRWKPGICRFNQANTNSKSCDPTKMTGIQLLGIWERVAGK